MEDRPTVAMALAPRLVEGMFTALHRARLGAVCQVPDAEPLATWDDPRADALLAGELRVALGAHTNLDVVDGRTRLVHGAAGARDRRQLVFRVMVLFHRICAGK